MLGEPDYVLPDLGADWTMEDNWDKLWATINATRQASHHNSPASPRIVVEEPQLGASASREHADLPVRHAHLLTRAGGEHNMLLLVLNPIQC